MEARAWSNLLPPELQSDNLSASDISPGVRASMLGIQLASVSAPSPGIHAVMPVQWTPYHSPAPSSSRSGPLDSILPTTRLTNQQDAWSPLQATGVLEQGAGYGQPYIKAYQAHGIGSGYPDSQCSSSSECGDKYGSFSFSDSGYGSKKGTASSVATSFAVNSNFGSQALPNKQELGERVLIFEQNAVPHNESNNAAPLPINYRDQKCSHPGCNWISKCPSEKRKHEARHKKLFICDAPNCRRKEGFGTANDLARHKKCVHHQEPERGPKMTYKCFGKNCKSKGKEWPRLDNFRQHLTRMHKKENEDVLLNRSREWYENSVKPQQSTLPVARRSAQQESKCQSQSTPDLERVMKTSQPGIYSSVAPSRTIIPAETAKSAKSLTLNPIKSLSVQSAVSKVNASSDHHVPSPLQPLELPPLKSLSLPGSKGQSTPTSQPDHRQDEKMESAVADAARNMLHVLTNIMNGSQQRRQQPGSEDDTDEQRPHELPTWKRDMLKKILLSALAQLARMPGPNLPVPEKTVVDPGKRDGIRCAYCPKQTLPIYEAKNHQKTHEKRYGCTFMGCKKAFDNKINWQSHENDLRFHQECWRCDLEDPGCKCLPCAQLFYNLHLYVKHLETQHNITGDKVKARLSIKQTDRNGQSHYWCGFCRKVLPLMTRRERFDHVGEHFERGEQISDWLPEPEQVQAREKDSMETRDTNQPGAVGRGHNDGPSNIASGDGSRKDNRRPPIQLTQHPLVGSKNASLIYRSKPEPNQLKRKYAAPEPYHTPSASCMKRQIRAKPSASLFNNAPEAPRQSYQAAEGQWQSSTVQTERDYSRKDGLPQDQVFVYCCQCKDGPFYPYTTVQCITCNHALCASCEVKGLPSADECM